MHKPNFKMHTIKWVWQLIQQGDNVFSTDLKDAHLHTVIVKHKHCFLQFVWQNKPYQWKVLPFGLATQPLGFSLFLLNPYCSIAITRVFTLFFYLADILVLVCSKHPGKRACYFLYSELHLTQDILFFRVVLGYSAYVYISAI